MKNGFSLPLLPRAAGVVTPSACTTANAYMLPLQQCNLCVCHYRSHIMRKCRPAHQFSWHHSSWMCFIYTHDFTHPCMLGTGERPRHAFPAAAPWRVVDRNHGPPAPPQPVRRISRHRPRSEYRGRIPRHLSGAGPRFKTRQTRYPMGYPVRVKWDLTSESYGISHPSQIGYPV